MEEYNSKNFKQVGVMVKIRINRRKEKRGDTKGVLLLALLFFLLFPYIISGFSDVEKQTLAWEEVPGQIWVVEKKIWGSQKMPLEEYLVGMVAATIPGEYETETLKAQSIILRSFCMNHMKKEEGKKVVYDEELKDYYFSKEEREEVWGEKATLYHEKIQNAVNDTKGIILVCKGDIVAPPFCRMSNGSTREITEYVVRKENYEYMKTVVCSKDELAEEYIQYIEVPQKEFESIIKKLVKLPSEKLDKITIYRDSKQYVKEIQIGEQRIDGEDFRKAFGLVSSCFSLDKLNDVIEIQTKGMGHGFGFSQYEANQMAVSGRDYNYLLNYFFENVTLEKM